MKKIYKIIIITNDSKRYKPVIADSLQEAQRIFKELYYTYSEHPTVINKRLCGSTFWVDYNTGVQVQGQLWETEVD